MHPLEFLVDLIGDLLCGFVAPERKDGWGCLFWLVVLVLLAAGIGWLLYRLA